MFTSGGIARVARMSTAGTRPLRRPCERRAALERGNEAIPYRR